jgi:voltage-gated potassium channel Kch
LLSHILKSKKVDSEIIYGAICAYLLIGFMWGGIYLLIEVLNPGSFYIDAAHNIDNKTTYADFLYFSFVTVATLGYGDISPVTPLARNVSIMEGIIGVFYLAILVARLVGLYTVESNRK